MPLFANCTEPEPGANVTHLWIGDHPDDIGTLNGSTSGLGNLDGRARVCPDGNGGFIVTPLAAQDGDNVEFRFFKDPPNAVSLDGPAFGMASFLMGDAVFTGSVTADTVVIQNQEPPYPGAEVAARMIFNGVDIGADNILINSTDNDETPNTDLQIIFNGGGLTALEQLSINASGATTELQINGGNFNADTLEMIQPGIAIGTVNLTLSNTAGTVKHDAQIGHAGERVNLTIKDGSELEWAKLGGFTTIGDKADVELKIESGSSLKSYETFIAFNEDSEVQIVVDDARWETGFLAAGGFGDIDITARNGSELETGSASLGHFQNFNFGHETEVTLEASTWNVSGFMNIGAAGDASLTMKDGSNVDVQGLTILADLENSLGRLEVLGTSIFTAEQSLEVGRNSIGSMVIKEGGAVLTKGDAFVGTFAPGEGDVEIDGADSSWEILGNLNIGNNGKGELKILNGGELKVDDSKEIRIGRREGSEGKLFLSGADSKITGSANLNQGMVAGQDGKGEIVMENGALIDNEDLKISLGLNEKGVGSLEAKGEGTELHLSTLSAGVEGVGSVDIKEGAKVTLKDGLNIGEKNQNERSSFKVQNQNSLLEVDGDVIVGDSGEGELILSDGAKAKINGGDIILGNKASGDGRLNISGAATKIEGDAEIVIGNQGRGVLDISGGATFEFESLELGKNADSDGTLKVRDAGSQVEIKKGMTLGAAANAVGSVTLTDQALLKTGTEAGGPLDVSILGKTKDTRGNVILENGSEWRASSNIRVGDEGVGQLSVMSGSVLNAEKDLTIGSSAGSEGFLSIEGRDQNYAAVQYDTLNIGMGGRGIVSVEEGGILTGENNSTRVIVGGRGEDGTKGEGEVTLSGENTQWLLNGGIGLTVGQHGKGHVGVVDGAAAVMKENSQLALGTNQDSKGTIIVGGGSDTLGGFKASRFLTGNEVLIGMEGEGEITVLDGGEFKPAGSSENLVTKVGTQENGSGKVLITDEESLWETGNLELGGEGRASMTVEHNAEVVSRDVKIRGNAANPTTATLSESRWDMNKLSINEYAKLQAETGVINAKDNIAVSSVGDLASRPELTLNNSQMSTEQDLRVGNGILNANHSTIIAEDAFVGQIVGSSKVALDDTAMAVTNLTVGTGQAALDVTNNSWVRVQKQLKVQGQGVLDTKAGFVTVGGGTQGELGDVEIYSGGILSGTGTILGDVHNISGTVTPGNSPGTLTIDGDFILDELAVLELEIGGTAPGFFDFLDIKGQAIFKPGSILELKFINGFAPREGDLFSFIEAEQGLVFIPELLKISVSGLLPGFAFSPDFSDGNFSITALNDGAAALVPEPGTLILTALGLAGLALKKSKR